MEMIKRLSDVAIADLEIVERVFGQRIERTEDAVLILKTLELPPAAAGAEEGGSVPSWCDVLEGLSEDELADFRASLAEPVRLAQSTDSNGS